MNGKPTYASQQRLTGWTLAADLQDDHGLHLVLKHGGSTYRLELSPEQTAELRRAVTWPGGGVIEQEGPA